MLTAPGSRGRLQTLSAARRKQADVDVPQRTDGAASGVSAADVDEVRARDGEQRAPAQRRGLPGEISARGHCVT